MYVKIINLLWLDKVIVLHILGENIRGIEHEQNYFACTCCSNDTWLKLRIKVIMLWHLKRIWVRWVILHMHIVQSVLCSLWSKWCLHAPIVKCRHVKQYKERKLYSLARCLYGVVWVSCAMYILWIIDGYGMYDILATCTQKNIVHSVYMAKI